VLKTHSTRPNPLTRPGPTVIIDQVFDQAAGRPSPEDPASSALVYPLTGGYCVFDGRLGHGVLDSFAASRRATLLVNWWTHQPQARPGPRLPLRAGRGRGRKGAPVAPGAGLLSRTGIALRAAARVPGSLSAHHTRTPQAVHVATDAQLRELGFTPLPAATAAGGEGDAPAAAGPSSECTQGGAAVGAAVALSGLRLADGGGGGGGGGDGGGGSGGSASAATTASSSGDGSGGGEGGGKGDAGGLDTGVVIPEVSAPPADGLDHAVLVRVALSRLPAGRGSRIALSAALTAFDCV
jgi:hypothetical protein